MEDILITQKKRLMQATTLLLFILSAVAVATFFLVANAIDVVDNEYAQNTISVSGKGEVIAVPDIATIRFNVREEADTAAEAQELASEKMNDIKEFLDDADIEENDIKTTSYNVNEVYEYFYEHPDGRICASSYCPPPYVYSQEVVGYEVSQSVLVKIREIDEAGEILSGITRAGAANVSGLTLTVEDEDELKTQAREKAIADAREQAKRLAKELGVKLGDVISFNEHGNYPVYYDGYGRGGEFAMLASSDAVEEKSSAPSVPVGENEIVSNVTIIYEIK